MSPATGNALLEAAVGYARRGWYIYPSFPGSKFKTNLNWRQASTRDEAMIRKWWTQKPGSTICCDCGKSGLAVIDVDVRDGKRGDTSLAALEADHGMLPYTLQQITASGGLHYIFKGKCRSVNGKLGEGIDIKSDGGMIVLAPSVINDKKYTLYDLESTEPVELPQWVADLAGAPTKRDAAPEGEFEPAYTDEEFAERLKLIDVTQFDDSYDLWRDFVFACSHSSTVDDGKVAFMEWTTQSGPGNRIGFGQDDEDYNRIERIWDAAYRNRNKKGGVTIGSFNRYLTLAGHGDKIAVKHTTAAEDFGSDPAIDDDTAAPSKGKTKRSEVGKAKHKPLTPEQRAKLIAQMLLMVELIRGTAEGDHAKRERENAAEMLKARMEAYGISFEDMGLNADGSNPDDGCGAVPPGWDKWTNVRSPWDDIKTEWSYVVQQRKFVRCKERPDPTGGRYILDKESFDSKFDHVQIAGRGRAQKMSDFIFKLPPGVFQQYDSFCFMPGAPERYHDSLNTFVPSVIVPRAGDTGIWDDHLRYLFPDNVLHGHLLDWLAWVYQNPQAHPQYALVVHGSEQGTGKSFIGQVLHKLLSGAAWETLTYEIVAGPHPTWPLRTKLAIVELRQHDNVTTKFTDKVHHMITGNSLHVNIKGKDDFNVRNVVAFLVEMNHMESLKGLDHSDRRWLVLSTDTAGNALQPKHDAYYTLLYGRRERGVNVGGVLNDPAALAAIAHQLATRDLSKYSGARAPKTSAKDQVRAASASALASYMLEHIDDYPFNRTVVHLEEIVEAIPKDIARSVKDIRKEIATVLSGPEYYGEPLGKVRLGRTIKFGDVSTDRPKLWALHRTRPKPDPKTGVTPPQTRMRDVLKEGDFKKQFWKEREFGDKPQSGVWDEAARRPMHDFFE